MFPASTNGGGAVLAFQDVCKTPSPAGPIPIAYPNVAGASQGQKNARKVKTRGGVPMVKSGRFSSSSGDEPGAVGGIASSKVMDTMRIRRRLNDLHGQLIALPANNPNRWHELLDEYVIATAEVYITLSD